MIKDAIILSIDPDTASARIQYRDNSEIQVGVKIAGRLYWNLQEGDYVIVAYIAGDQSDPIILDKVLVKGDPLLGTERPPPDDIKLLHTVKNDSGDITGQIVAQTDKNGSLNLELTGDIGTINLKALGEEGNINIEGNGSLSITAPSGVVVNSDGNVEVNSSGDVKLEASGSVEIDGGEVLLGNNLVKQIVNNLPTCIMTGAPHSVGNQNVKV